MSMRQGDDLPARAAAPGAMGAARRVCARHDMTPGRLAVFGGFVCRRWTGEAPREDGDRATSRPSAARMQVTRPSAPSRLPPTRAIRPR